MSFLLGPSSVGPSGQYNRRWAPQQLKEWHNLYGLLCNLTLICKTESQWNIQPEINRPDVSLHLCNLLDIPDDVVKSLYSEATDRFLKESLLTLRSLNETESFIVDCLCYTLCHAAWCCEQFSFKLINEILLLPDPYQKQRVESVLCFGVNKSETETNPDSIGLFYIIQKNKDHDTRRSYLCIKFLVRISSKCAIAKELLKEHLTEWKWCGDWLKSKLKDNHGWSSCISAISNEISSTTTLQRTYSTQRHPWPGVQENTRSNVPITEHGNGSNADMPPFIENHGIH